MGHYRGQCVYDFRDFREKSDKEQAPLRSFQLQLSPGDLNHYYVGTEKVIITM